MAALVWDQTGKKYYETGVDKGVYYPLEASGAYGTGEAWDGLMSVEESHQVRNLQQSTQITIST